VAQSRRGEILEVAAKIFNEKGYQSATLEDVGDHFGFTRAALYYYFKNKQAILDAIVDDASETLLVSLRAILDAELPPAECLRRIVVNHVVVLHSRPHVFGVFLAEPTSLPEQIRERMEQMEREYIDLVAAVYDSGVRAGQFSADFPTKIAILLILGMANNTKRWLHPATVESGRIDPEALAQMLFDMVSGGFSGKRARGRSAARGSAPGSVAALRRA
jgi:AcrR family transcriptional regulator